MLLSQQSQCSWCYWFPLDLHSHSQGCIPGIPFPSFHSIPQPPQGPHVIPVENHSGRAGFRMGFYHSSPEAAPAPPASCCCPGASTWISPVYWDSGPSHSFPLLLILSCSFPSFPFPFHPISHLIPAECVGMREVGASPRWASAFPLLSSSNHPTPPWDLHFQLLQDGSPSHSCWQPGCRILPGTAGGAVLNPAPGIGVGGFASAGDTRLRRGIPAG